MPVLNTLEKVLMERGMTAYALAQRTALSQNTIYRLLKKPAQMPSGSVLKKLCQVLECQPGDLLTYVPDPSED